jgi:hypothetical protein
MGIITNKYGRTLANSHQHNKYGNSSLSRFFATGLVIFTAACPLANSINYSEGQRVGVINKVSKKGVFIKTNEAQMALEGLVSTGDTMSANVWEFSVDKSMPDDKQYALTKDLEEAMEAHTRVKIKYTEALTSAPWRGSTSYYVQEVTPIEEPERK